MDDQNQNSKIVGTIVALLAVVLGVGFVHENLQSSRPYSPLASQNFSDVEDFHRVESRLWQDPFECFESETNSAPVDNLSGVTNEVEGEVQQLPWDDINERRANGKGAVAILAVTLPGSSYGEDREVRLRLRYAVQVALLTQNVGPDDNTHIYTNSVWLNPTNPEGGVSKNARLSQYAYEWFSTENNKTNWQVCVLWLNEDDFADEPAMRLGSLMEHIPGLQDSNRQVSFYLIGPRSSGTLRGLADTQTNGLPADIYSTLTGAVLAGNFNILSPEATVSVVNTNGVDIDGKEVGERLGEIFQKNIFYNWIATDAKVAGLMARELKSRISGPLAKSTNVVVLLSEQDTYYGRRLADEWQNALVNSNVCDSDHVWQFSYLRGLDGSKPEAERPAEATGSEATPEAALETAMKQQQTGQRADGDAQLDYMVRLADYLKKKDEKMKEEGTGRIIAFGFACSDTYDKLILLEELRDHFPEAVFFTSDLDAGLWTTQDRRYTRNLLVGSADPVNPRITETNTQPAEQEFAPFRDVYQSAVYRACYHAVQYEENGCLTNLQAQARDLRGGVYEIGKHGPVRLSDSESRQSLDYAANPLWPARSVLVGVVALTALVAYFAAGLSGGLFMGKRRISSESNSWALQRAENKEFKHQLNLVSVPGAVYLFGIIGIFLLYGGFYFLTWRIARMPGEEPWSFWDGISIWPTEYIRFLAIAGSACFFFLVERSRHDHLKDLWKRYFAEEGDFRPQQQTMGGILPQPAEAGREVHPGMDAAVYRCAGRRSAPGGEMARCREIVPILPAPGAFFQALQAHVRHGGALFGCADVNCVIAERYAHVSLDPRAAVACVRHPDAAARGVFFADGAVLGFGLFAADETGAGLYLPPSDVLAGIAAEI